MDPTTLMLLMMMLGGRKEREVEAGLLPLLLLCGCFQNTGTGGTPCSCTPATATPTPPTQVTACVPQGCNPLILALALRGGSGFGDFFGAGRSKRASVVE
jgi:hypothetical protein